jgi:hypothetical protein
LQEHTLEAQTNPEESSHWYEPLQAEVYANLFALVKKKNGDKKKIIRYFFRKMIVILHFKVVE